MNDKLLNEFVDFLKIEYKDYLIYIDFYSDRISLIMDRKDESYNLEINSLHKYSSKDNTSADLFIKDIKNIYMIYYREHKLNSIMK